MASLDFKRDIPEVTGVYIVVDADKYETFMSNPYGKRLNGLHEVFLKKGVEGKFYAAGDDIKLTEEEFKSYVWARKGDFN